jgi:ABC-type Na+ efflux pump permease subunit
MGNVEDSLKLVLGLVLFAIILQFLAIPVLGFMGLVLRSGIMSTDLWEVGLALILLAGSLVTVAIGKIVAFIR